MKLLSVFAVLATVSSLCAVRAAPCESLEANKKVAKALLDDVFNKKDVSAVDKYIGTTYLQHNPHVADGPQSLKDFAKTFTNETKAEFGAIVAGGDLVFVNTRYTGLPGSPTTVAMDAFRFENGKIVEHWDVLQNEVPADKTASKRPMFPIQGAAKKAPVACNDGCGEVDPQVEANKKTAKALLDEVFNKKDVTAVDRYVGSVYLQHNPAVPDGPESLKGFAAVFTNETKAEFGAILAHDDLVFVNTRYLGLPGSATSVAVDAFRFENGKIVEHWDVLQTEVLKTASGRPMFPIQGKIGW